MDLTDINARFEPDIDAESEAAQRRQRLAVQVTAVRRRSRRIKTLRTVFPAVIILLLLLNIGWITATSIANSLNIYGGNSDEIRMTNPRFVGEGGKGGHYTISGLEAVRKGKDSQIFTLKAPVMEFHGDGDSTTHMQGLSGVLDQGQRSFTITGDVVLTTGSQDFTFKTQEAIVDLANSTVHGDKHIEGSSPTVHIGGESFVISGAGKDIVISGRGDTQVRSVMQADVADKQGSKGT